VKSIAIVQYLGENGENDWRLSEPYRSGKVVSGILKLAQEVMEELFTQTGSVAYFPDYGSRLPYGLRGMNGTSVNELENIVVMALDDVKVNRKNRLVASDFQNLDEVLAELTLLNLDQEYDRVALVFSLTSAAGNSRVIKMPVDFNNNE